jgi:hypothetical protein
MSINKTLPRRYLGKREFIPGLTDHLLEYGVKVDMHEELVDYLVRLAGRYESSCGMMKDSARARALADIYLKLADLADMRWAHEEARRYSQLACTYGKEVKRTN